MAGESSFALLLTWTCYGTWLPGDSRGYVSDTFVSDSARLPKQNTPGTDYTADDPTTVKIARARQKHTTTYLNRPQANQVAAALVEAACARAWHIAQAAIMFNHVHIVVMDCPDDGPAVRRVLKGVSQAHLSSVAGQPRRWWTRGGSDRYLHGERAIESATAYVAKQHGILAEIRNMEVVDSQP